MQYIYAMMLTENKRSTHKGDLLMSENKSDLLKSLTKKLAVGLPIVALSGILPGTDGMLVNNASAEHHSEADYKNKYKKAKAKAEAEAEGEAKAEAEAEGEAESESKKY